ncbi:unnamed protein product [Urochloa humidicola]
MAILVSGPHQNEGPGAAKKQRKKPTRPDNCDARSAKPVVQPPPAEGGGPPPPPRQAAAAPSGTSGPRIGSGRLQAAVAATSSSEEEEWQEEDPAAADASDSGEVEFKKLLEGTATAAAAAASSGKKSGEEEGQEEDPADAVAPDSGEVESKKLLEASVLAAATSGKKRGEEEGQEEDPAAAVAPDCGEVASKKLLLLHTAATTTSAKKGVEEDLAPARSPSGKKVAQGTDVPTSDASWVWSFLSRPWLQQRRLQGPDFLWKKLSLLNRLFECCGLIDLTVSQDLKISHEDLRVPHVRDKRPISQAECYYELKAKVATELSQHYSSFRVVLGDGECFYRSFIYSYLELILENDDHCEEDHLLYVIEEISLGCMDLEWLNADFYKSYTAFKELVQKVKRWKAEMGAVRRTLLLAYFADYKETEDILTFLRVTSASWILTHQAEFSAFYVVEDGMTLEQHCRMKIIKSRSYAEHLAISALSQALGIPIRIFLLQNGVIQDIDTNYSGQSTRVPTASLAYTGIHYDILYPN